MQQNIYFRKDVWEKLKHEAKKSDLINNLLADHYAQPGPEKVISITKVIKTPKDAEKAVKPIQKAKKADVTYQKKTNWGA